MAMDELEISKIVGAGCAALLALVGFGQLGSAVVGVDQLDEPAYKIEIAEAEVSDEAVEEEAPMPIGELMAMAVVDDGPKVFRKCSACHKADKGAANGVGPALYGVVGRDIGSMDGYGYSNVLAEMGGQWDFASLNGFLEAPKKWAPGTKMGFAGLSKPEDRASVIAWMNEQSDAPLPMPAADAEEEAAAPAMTEEAEAPAAAEEAEAPAAVEEAEAPAAVEEAEAPAAVEEAEAPAVVEEAEAPAVVEEAEAPAAVEEAEAPAAVEEAEAPAAVEEAEAPAAVEEAEAPAAVEETEVAMATPEADPAPVAVASAATFMVGADAAKGKKVFRKCQACHKVNADGGNGVGPNLYGVVGRDIGSVDGFRYSDALSGKGGVWDFEALAGFLENPKGWAPGTKMSYRGLKKEQDRADVIAYLNENGDSPVALPE